ncbi:ABC transporter substrate-binding protein [Bacillus sp. FJAT-44742]|uniref:ABC transporter substrate-binding protein n=1 Tax=Bacillus sp. FJAT-44742 TaxID=2014005 RepID=UPI000C24B25C|nr:ABC transporter substrate-binding protein [Bacillus sp. FJAT-44742]
MKWSKIYPLSLLLAGTLILAACGAEGDTETGAAEADGDSLSQDEAVVIENNGEELTFEEAPQRAVTLNQHVTEVMLALGLEDHMAGTAYLDDGIHPDYKEAYESVPVLADQYPSQEPFLNVEPDFAYAGWESAFTEDNIGTFTQLLEYGITPYLHESSSMVGPTLDDVYQDITNIGQIFGVEDKAEELISTMDQRIADVQAQIDPDTDDPFKVFVYDSGEQEPMTGSQFFMTNLIEMAGGTNIFSDALDQNWGNVSWEAVIEEDPEWIVIVDYGETTAEQKKEFLLSYDALESVTAIQEENFVVVPLSAAAEGVRAPEAFELMAEGFYPDIDDEN